MTAAERMRKFRAEHPDRAKEIARRYYQNHRAEVLASRWEVWRKAIVHYGGKCVECGETDLAFLEIDHIANDGDAHRQREPYAKSIGWWLKKNNYPEGFQVLCWTHNKAKRRRRRKE